MAIYYLYNFTLSIILDVNYTARINLINEVIT